MTGWDELLAHLAAVPREDGSAAVHATATWLVDTLHAAGLHPELVAFTATPFALRLAGAVALGGGLLYLRFVRAGRVGAALATAIALPALLLGELEAHWPVFGWLGAETQHHVRLVLPARHPEQRLVFSAHYDTKTDALDHVERAPIDLLALPVAALLLAGPLAALAARRVRRGARALRGLAAAAGWVAAVYGALTFVALSAGAFARARSPGALDDGGSCAVLVRVAEELAASGPLERTEVELLWLSAEEVGVQGSWVYAGERFAAPPSLPTAVINLEGLGASTSHAVLPSERTTLRAWAPDPRLVARLDAAHRARFGRPLARLPVGGATDARSFLARGIPALTLVSLEPGSPVPRGLHSARDERSRLDVAALAASAELLVDVARAEDAQGP